MAADQVQAVLGKPWGNRPIPPGAGVVDAVGKSPRVYRSAACSERFTMKSQEFMATPLGSDAESEFRA
jgi:hypothetical protein